LPKNQSRQPCFILAPQLLKGPVVWKDLKVWGEKVSSNSASENSIEGTWTHTLEIPAGETQMELKLNQEGEKWTGTLIMQGQKVGDRVEAIYKNHILTYQTTGRIDLKGNFRVTGNTFKGTASRIGDREVGPRLMALIDQTIQEFNIDRNRLYITGQSGGGANTWGMLSLYPNVFAVAIPLCGRADVKAARDIVKGNVAIWVFHGTIDHLIRVEASRQIVEALKQAGGQPKYTEFPNVKHDVWIDAFPDPELYKWLFGQSRKPRKE
jgi:predicted esterase